jgi:hypothetical protein
MAPNTTSPAQKVFPRPKMPSAPHGAPVEASGKSIRAGKFVSSAGIATMKTEATIATSAVAQVKRDDEPVLRRDMGFLLGT